MIQARLHSSRLASPRGYDHMSKTQFPIELMLNINLTKAFQYLWKDLVMMCNLSKKKKDLVKCKFSSMLCWKLDTLKWTSKKQID